MKNYVYKYIPRPKFLCVNTFGCTWYFCHLLVYRRPHIDNSGSILFLSVQKQFTSRVAVSMTKGVTWKREKYIILIMLHQQKFWINLVTLKICNWPLLVACLFHLSSVEGAMFWQKIRWIFSKKRPWKLEAIYNFNHPNTWIHKSCYWLLNYALALKH